MAICEQPNGNSGTGVVGGMAGGRPGGGGRKQSAVGKMRKGSVCCGNDRGEFSGVGRGGIRDGEGFVWRRDRCWAGFGEGCKSKGGEGRVTRGGGTAGSPGRSVICRD